MHFEFEAVPFKQANSTVITVPMLLVRNGTVVLGRKQKFYVDVNA